MVTLADVASLAIENARLYQAEREARQQAEALKRIAETISSSLSIDRVLSVALEGLHQIVSYDSVTVFVLDEYFMEQDCCHVAGDTHFLSILAARGFDDIPDRIKTGIPAAQVALFQEMCAHKQPIALSDVQFGNRYANWTKSVLPRQWLGVPVVATGQMIGQLSIDRHTETEFTLHEIEIATTFARQVAGALVNARLYYQARNRADELAILNDVAMAVSTSLDLDLVLQRALDAIIALLDLDGGAILLVDESTKELVPRVSRGLAPEVLGQTQDSEQESIRHQVMIAQKTVVIGPPIDVPQDVRKKGKGTLIFVPILAHSSAAGVMAIQENVRSRFSTQQLSVLEAIGRQIGIAVERAYLQGHLDRGT
jgi:GAF domain-containing protein